MKVPMIVSCPGKIRENHRDATHLVSGLDVMSTMCDYAAMKPPPDVRGRSLRPLLEGNQTQWREFLGADCHQTGRIIRTADYKYVRYPNDPVEQLFDLTEDPGETRNLAGLAEEAATLDDLRGRLIAWEGRMDLSPRASEALAPHKAKGPLGVV